MEAKTRYRCEFHCMREAHQCETREGVGKERWHVECRCPPTPANAAKAPALRSAKSSLGVVDLTKINENTKGEALARRGPLPWAGFVPVQRNDSNWSEPRGSKKSDFKDLLHEGRKRLEKAEKEENLRGHAEVVGRMGSGALNDLLADIREPTFSRRQNERLRQGIAAKLRAKVARLFGRIMSKYFVGSTAQLQPGEHSLARATATFRVKLKRLLNQANLGKIQNQVTQEIAGVTSNTRSCLRRRECCMNTYLADTAKGGTFGAKNAGAASGISTTTAQAHTANSQVAQPQLPTKRATTVIPDVPRGNVRIAGTHPSPPANKTKSDCHLVMPAGGGTANRRPDSSCSTVEVVAHKLSGDGNAAVLDVLGLPDEAETLDSSADESWVSGSTSASCSAESAGTPHRRKREWSSSDSKRSLLAEGNEKVLHCSEPCGEHGQEYDKLFSGQSVVTKGEQDLTTTKPPKSRHRGRKSRHNCRSIKNGNGGEERATNTVAVDEAWLNRSLTVILTELGLYKSCQRTMLSNHMPANFKDDVDGQTRPEARARPLPRIDRPHFTPAFVELAAARKSRTLLMCPEPVAPGYEYSDVIEEVVKLHPPIGPLILEDGNRGNIVTRSDALAHAENFERGPAANQAKLLAAEFLADSDIGKLLASAETLELDLAQCAAAGTLFDYDVP